MFSIVIPFIITILFIPVLIYILKQKLYFQQISQDTPDSHKLKNKTPSMGGVVITFALCCMNFIDNNIYNTFLTFAALLFTIIGAIDDIDKLIYKRLGITPNTKLKYQIMMTIIVLLFGYSIKLIDNIVYLPGLGAMDIGFTAIPLYIFAIVGSSNAVNLTDGLDGLATLTSISTILALSYLAQINFPEVSYFCYYLVSALLGFLLYNKYPARIFMGDAGSLMLGAIIAIIAICTHNILLLPIIGAIFVIETLSVILQVYYFKRYEKKFLLMSPLHHHFELLGWHEVSITYVFFTASVVFAIIGIFLGTI